MSLLLWLCQHNVTLFESQTSTLGEFIVKLSSPFKHSSNLLLWKLTKISLHSLQTLPVFKDIIDAYGMALFIFCREKNILSRTDEIVVKLTYKMTALTDFYSSQSTMLWMSLVYDYTCFY